MSVTQYLEVSKEADSLEHGLSQQGVWVPFGTPKPLKRTPQDTQIILCGISKNLNLKLMIEIFHLLIIPMTLIIDIMPYFDEFLHVYGWNISISWSPLKIWTPKNFTTANFRHPVSKSWLRHWLGATRKAPFHKWKVCDGVVRVWHLDSRLGARKGLLMKNSGQKQDFWLIYILFWAPSLKNLGAHSKI